MPAFDPLDPRLHVQLIGKRRGLDLGDDEALLAWLTPLWESGRLAADHRWSFGVICFRRGRFAEAAAAFESLEEEDGTGQARFLRAWSLLRGGDHDALADVLVEVPGIAPAWVAHLRGAAATAAGRHQAARTHLEQAVAADPTLVPVWFDLGTALEELGAYAPALAAYEAVLARQPHHVGATYGRIVAVALLGRRSEAARMLGRALFVGDVAERARFDDRLDGLWPVGTLKQIALGPRPDVSWLERAGGWLGRLVREGHAEQAGLAWVSDAMGRRHDRAQRTRYREEERAAGILWNDGLWALCGEIVRQQRLVARGPAIEDRRGMPHLLHWYVDVAGEQLWLGLGADAPPAFRVPAGRTIGSIVETMAPYHPRSWLPSAAFPVTRRAFAGGLDGVSLPSGDAATPHALARHWAVSPFVDLHAWGSAHGDDPWPERIPAQPDLGAKLARYQNQVLRQQEGGRCRTTRRTLFSGSLVSLELHDDLYVWEIRHRSAAHTRTLARLNDAAGVTLPLDLPIDVAGALYGFGWEGVSCLEGRGLEALDALAAVRSDGLDGPRWFAAQIPSADSPTLEAIGRIAARYNWEFLLEDLLLHAPADARSALRDLLDGGIPAPAYDARGEPDGLLEVL
jgi:tetratricopeptide (TPR) repeat protein